MEQFNKARPYFEEEKKSIDFRKGRSDFYETDTLTEFDSLVQTECNEIYRQSSEMQPKPEEEKKKKYFLPTT